MDFLRIEHFKCFEDTSVPINGLTILVGANGNGKSSAIQALLYLRRTIEHCGDWLDGRYIINRANGLNVGLNGVYGLALGNSSIVLNRATTSNTISIGMASESGELKIEYEADNLESQLWLTPKTVTREANEGSSLFQQEFYYLNAERSGPRISQPLQFFDYPNAGWQGETTAQLIDLESGYFKIEDERRFKANKSNFIKDQVNYWLGFIVEDVKVTAKTSKDTMTSQVLLENSYTINEPIIATNIGFGISYALPIIATGLVAKKGSFFVVENPEAHLHPSAQSKMGQFLAMVAHSGVNVIVETHSDHVINGIQIAAVEKVIDHNLVAINFFATNGESSQPEITRITVNSNGELSQWPKGFFDQTQVDYAHLFKLRQT